MMRTLAAVLAAPLILTLLIAPAHAEDRTGSGPRHVFDVRGLPTGPPPGLPYAERTRAGAWTIVAGGVRTRAVAGLSDFASMGSGYVVQSTRRGPARTRWISAGGVPGARTWRGGYGLAVSARGGAVAFTGRRGSVRIIDSEGDRVLRLPSVPTRRPTSAVGVVGEDCQEDEDSTGCTVFVRSLATTTSWLTSSHGIVDTLPVRQVSTVRGRWLGGITRTGDSGTCSAMTRGARIVWRTCRNAFSDISSTRTHVLGVPAYADGLGPQRLDVLDLRTGDRVRSWVPNRRGSTAVYFDEVWEDPEHLLVVTLQRRRWAVVRLGLDGSMEYAVRPRRGGADLSAPLQLAVG